MSILKKTAAGFLVLLFLLVAWQHELVLYGLSQLRGQLQIINKVQSVSDVLKDPRTSATWKDKFLLIQKIKEFATDSLGLTPSENYTTFYDQHDKPVLWVLTGCLPFELKPKTWWFPLLGNVSYKGFFDRKKGEKAREDLKKEGYETDLSPVFAWSTLGWFKDPVLSNMLKKGEGTLSELIIHELTHGTIYLKSSVDFNENLATFVGEQGALNFLLSSYGAQSSQYIKYVQYKSDEGVYGNYMNDAYKKLDTLYHSFTRQTSDIVKARKKNELIVNIMQGIDSLPLNHKERYLFIANEDSLPNNTYFMSNNRYRKNQQKIETVFNNRFNKNLPFFISYLKKTEPQLLTTDLKE